MTYLITGGCGFIGVNFAQKLLDMGNNVILLDNLSRKGADLNLKFLLDKYQDNCVFQKADISDNSSANVKKISKLIEQSDVVYHLAGQVAVTTSIENPTDDFFSNAFGTLNLLELVRKSSNKPIFIYASTNKVYGGMEEIDIIELERRFEYKNLPNGISEWQNLDFHSPYGCSKGCADQYVRDYARIYGLKTVVMRQSCIYGPRQFGIEDQGWVAWFAIASLSGKKITIYGNGKQVRDVLYIDDLFDAWQLAEKNIELTAGQIFNVGGGAKFSLSLLEFIEILKNKIDKPINFDFADWRAGDQPVYISDIRKIEEVISWKPKTEINEGLDMLLEWVKEARF